MTSVIDTTSLGFFAEEGFYFGKRPLEQNAESTSVDTLEAVSASPAPVRNVFTVCDTRRASMYASSQKFNAFEPLPYPVLETPPTSVEVEEYKRELTENFVARAEAAAVMNENDRRHAVRQLIALAAQRDIQRLNETNASCSADVEDEQNAAISLLTSAEGNECDATADRRSLVIRTWKSLMISMEQYFAAGDDANRAQIVNLLRQTHFSQQNADPEQIAQLDEEIIASVANAAPLASMSSSALENVSSLGVWFTGEHISLPLRRYVVQIPVPDNSTPVEVVVVGLAVFSYSTYVMEVRQQAQQQLLHDLQMWSEQIGQRVMFIPQVVLQVPYIPQE